MAVTMASPFGPLVAGNWKMNGLAAALGEARRVRDRLGEAGLRRRRGRHDLPAGDADRRTCPRGRRGRGSLVGAQDCHAAASGAHTGDISAEMLKDAGATAVIVGHSERRADHGERDRDVQGQGTGGASRRADGDRVHRRDRGRARGPD